MRSMSCSVFIDLPMWNGEMKLSEASLFSKSTVDAPHMQHSSPSRFVATRFRRYVGLMLSHAFALVSCQSVTDPNFPAGAIPMTPPSVYSLWWELTKSCSGVTADFAAIHWFELPNASEFSIRDTTYQSYWWGNGNRIVVVGRKKFEGQLIRHEMLHSLTGVDHRSDYFLDKCGGVVACEGNCLKEAGALPQPAADAPVIDMSRVSVGVSIEPKQPSVQAFGGWIAITVTARALIDSTAWVSLSPVGIGSTASATFGYVDCVEGACDGSLAYKYVFADRIGFLSGQIRRYVFDRQLPAGDHLVRGFFNTDTAQALPLSIAR